RGRGRAGSSPVRPPGLRPGRSGIRPELTQVLPPVTAPAGGQGWHRASSDLPCPRSAATSRRRGGAGVAARHRMHRPAHGADDQEGRSPMALPLEDPVPRPTTDLLRELVAHLRKNRAQLREEWVRRIAESKLLTAMTKDEIFTEAT